MIVNRLCGSATWASGWSSRWTTGTASADGAATPSCSPTWPASFIDHDYDLKHVARLILNSRAYQAARDPPAGAGRGRLRRPGPAADVGRAAASTRLFAAVGKPFGAEELNLDPEAAGRRPSSSTWACRGGAWQFASTLERARPPRAVAARGRRASSTCCRPSAGGRRGRTRSPVRDEATTPLQPALARQRRRRRPGRPALRRQRDHRALPEGPAGRTPDPGGLPARPVAARRPRRRPPGWSPTSATPTPTGSSPGATAEPERAARSGGCRGRTTCSPEATDDPARRGEGRPRRRPARRTA